MTIYQTDTTVTSSPDHVHTSLTATVGQFLVASNTTDVVSGVPVARFVPSNDITITNSITTNDTITGLIVTPATPVVVANGATVALSATVSQNILRPTSDGTIAGAVLNFPTSPVNGQTCSVLTTGTITTVTGTLATATVPTLSTITSGTQTLFIYNTTAAKWFVGK